MAERKYKVGSDIYEIPEAEVQSFLKDFPNAQEVESYTVGKDTFDIPIKEIDGFLTDFPNAQPLKKKVSSEVSGENSGASSEEQSPYKLETPEFNFNKQGSKFTQSTPESVVAEELGRIPATRDFKTPDITLQTPEVGFKESIPETVGLDYLQGKEIPRAPTEARTVKEAIGATIGEFGRSFSSMIGDFGKLGTKIQDSFASLFLNDEQLSSFKKARDKNELIPPNAITLNPAKNLSNLLAQSVVNTKQLPKGVVGDVTRGMIHIIPDMTLAMAAPELALPEIFTKIGLKQFSKFGLEQGFRGMVEGMEYAEQAPWNLQISVPVLTSLERGMAGWMYEGMGRNASLVGQRIANKILPNPKTMGEIINKSILQGGGTAFTNGLYFSGYGGLDEYLRIGRITPENMYSGFGMGFAFSVPEMGRLMFAKGMNTILASPREGLRKIAQNDISSVDMARKSDELARNIEEGKSENPEGDAVMAFMLNKASQLKTVVDEIKDNPADIKKAINESEIDGKVKEALIDKVNEIVADNDIKVQKARELTDEIARIDEQLKDIRGNKAWDDVKKEVESAPLKTKKEELKNKVLEIYNKPVKKVETKIEEEKEDAERMREKIPSAKEALDKYLNNWKETVLKNKEVFLNEVKQDYDMVLTKLKNMDLIKTDCV